MKHLVAVGVGPGDPELVTVKAVRVLREADVVLAPVLTEAEEGRAEAIVRAHLPDGVRIRRVKFALNDRGGATDRRRRAWENAAATVRECFAGGASTVAFATIGDPNLYSTFTYLVRAVCNLVPDLHVETLPGITAMQDLAARSGTVLAEGSESLALVPLTDGLERLREALGRDGTVVAYKCGTRMPELRATLEASGRLPEATYGAMLGLSSEDVRPARRLDRDERTAYLSTVIAPGKRPQGGGKL